MRLWHYKLIPYLPKSQLLAQWRELNSIFKKQDRHILINYVYEYPKNHLLVYAEMVMTEMIKRCYEPKIGAGTNFTNYFGIVQPFHDWWMENPFPSHHTDRYLIQCFFNLQEKYDRGQKDFSEKEYKMLSEFVSRYLD